MLPAEECGLKLLREVEFNMLDFGTLVSRHVRFLKSLNTSGNFTIEILGQVLELTTEIQVLQQDLSYEIDKVITWVRGCTGFFGSSDARNMQLQRFHPGSPGEVGLLGEVKLYLMQLTAVMRRRRRSFAASYNSEATHTKSHATRNIDRSTECENLARNIADIQDDLSYEMKKVSNQVEPISIAAPGGIEEQAGDGEGTETDDEFVWLEDEIDASVESEEEEWLPQSSGKTK
ncbi:hypothetical protein BBO99_00000134 [Phytophthora kernoviae]|uniref:Uncharacterized protein n=2 Tax=Phytophthora kernoviae TaxID=325452 RepID=A0A3R7KPS6_9STRA|nr:hypothetical protein G195_001429 [Phytophthora kernoviae 00238/432]KAG2531488.1 hypothetical protein JM18_000406 [Phytophthora kernoviae]KAG2532604.1 hypothetical protein JM16_000298 [Phytophthora kernoviae]RLM96847.1 hypothetical protein BBI17_000236 [Phytophthora kernoviae]RLN85830.1 hypothetical protein BBO99_00000134 [Phytophthora kernoviae]